MHASQVPVLPMLMAVQIGLNMLGLDHYALQPIAGGHGGRVRAPREAWGALWSLVGGLKAT